MYIVFTLQCQKLQNNYQIMLKIAETSVVIIVFCGFLGEVRAYTVTVFYPAMVWFGVLIKWVK